jgi:putative CocE/NonD family hydrolase
LAQGEAQRRHGGAEGPVLHRQRAGRGALANADTWPPPDAVPTPFYLAGDGRLAREPVRHDGINYVVDAAASVAPSPRWGNVETWPADLAALGARGIQFETSPLDEEIEVTGHPVAYLRLSATVPDVDLFVYVFDIDAKGTASYVSEGCLRASHGATRPTTPGHLGLPYHRSFREDVAPLPLGQTVDLDFDLFPVSILIKAGHRIRIVIAGADAGNADAIQHTPPPTLTFQQDRA